MEQYIAVLRGINVGGKRKLPMSDLRDILKEAGLDDVKTYIQSGNVLFKSTIRSKDALSKSISEAIETHVKFEVPVKVFTIQEMAAILDKNPFDADLHDVCYYVLLFDAISEELKSNLLKKSNDKEPFKIVGNCVYLYPKEGYGKAKFNNNFFEKELETTATTRNHKTILKLLSLSAEN